MASTSITTFNKLQPREISISKHFSINTSIFSLSNFTPLNTYTSTATITLFASLTNHSVSEIWSLDDDSSLGYVKTRVKKEKHVKRLVSNREYSGRNDFSDGKMGNFGGNGEKALKFDRSRKKFSRGRNVISGDVGSGPTKVNDHFKKDFNFDGRKQKNSRGKNVILGDSGEPIKGNDHSNGYGKKDFNFDGKKKTTSRGRNVISGDGSREFIRGNDHSNGNGKEDFNFDDKNQRNSGGKNVISGDVSREPIKGIDHSDGNGKTEFNFDGKNLRISEGKNVISGVNVYGALSEKPIKPKKSENKSESPEFKLRIGLDKCSKMGDIIGAISLYDSALNHNIKLGQYHYTVLLYLCSSASMGIIHPAKSGSGSRTLGGSNELEHKEDHTVNDGSNKVGIRVSEELRKLALEKGLEIYERMCLEKVKMNEAALTSVARMAMAMGDGDTAFEMVKQMKMIGIKPKLRSYGPALLAYCGNGDVERAFEVERHMLENGVDPEEPELEALVRVSVLSKKGDRVYHLLHKLRERVRGVSPSVVDLIEGWFRSKEAARVGRRKWDPRAVREEMASVGGGWHGKGWLGKGKWVVTRTSVGSDGVCNYCGEKLVLIDLDPEETERFAESVAEIAVKRERNSSFQKFQRWLDYHGPFEAVVDAANVGLYSQRKFKPSKVNAVVNGIRQLLPSRKWPLIILHNRRLNESKMDKPVDRAVLDRWSNADALYATPTGSNDDWYWLYAAIKCKALLVTNDEMRDHTFLLLGNDFFPKWKERHQVRFSFSDVGPVFHMPPPCSVVIQESEWGHWHIPVASESQFGEDRIWLCVTRPKSHINKLKPEDGSSIVTDDEHKPSTSSPQHHDKSQSVVVRKLREQLLKHTENLRITPSESSLSSLNVVHTSVWEAIDAAEKLSGCTIDYQI